MFEMGVRNMIRRAASLPKLGSFRVHRNRTTLAASDHLPLVAEFEMAEEFGLGMLTK